MLPSQLLFGVTDANTAPAIVFRTILRQSAYSKPYSPDLEAIDGCFAFLRLLFCHGSSGRCCGQAARAPLMHFFAVGTKKLFIGSGFCCRLLRDITISSVVPGRPFPYGVTSEACRRVAWSRFHVWRFRRYPHCCE